MQAIKLRGINQPASANNGRSKGTRITYTAIGINWTEVHYPSSLAEIEEIKKGYSAKYSADEVEFLIQDDI